MKRRLPPGFYDLEEELEGAGEEAWEGGLDGGDGETAGRRLRGGPPSGGYPGEADEEAEKSNKKSKCAAPPPSPASDPHSRCLERVFVSLQITRDLTIFSANFV